LKLATLDFKTVFYQVLKSMLAWWGAASLGPGDNHQVERFGESFTNILKTWWGAFTLSQFFTVMRGG
jgi:hypothetical protein